MEDFMDCVSNWEYAKERRDIKSVCCLGGDCWRPADWAGSWEEPRYYWGRSWERRRLSETNVSLWCFLDQKTHLLGSFHAKVYYKSPNENHFSKYRLIKGFSHANQHYTNSNSIVNPVSEVRQFLDIRGAPSKLPTAVANRWRTQSHDGSEHNRGAPR